MKTLICYTKYLERGQQINIFLVQFHWTQFTANLLKYPSKMSKQNVRAKCPSKIAIKIRVFLAYTIKIQSSADIVPRRYDFSSDIFFRLLSRKFSYITTYLCRRHRQPNRQRRKKFSVQLIIQWLNASLKFLKEKSRIQFLNCTTTVLFKHK